MDSCHCSEQRRWAKYHGDGGIAWSVASPFAPSPPQPQPHSGSRGGRRCSCTPAGQTAAARQQHFALRTGKSRRRKRGSRMAFYPKLVVSCHRRSAVQCLFIQNDQCHLRLLHSTLGLHRQWQRSLQFGPRRGRPFQRGQQLSLGSARGRRRRRRRKWSPQSPLWRLWERLSLCSRIRRRRRRRPLPSLRRWGRRRRRRWITAFPPSASPRRARGRRQPEARDATDEE